MRVLVEVCVLRDLNGGGDVAASVICLVALPCFATLQVIPKTRGQYQVTVTVASY